MDGEPGELIGRGRAADIYALDAGRVLRRYRTAHRSEAEASLMRYLRQAGYPVPEVFGADGGPRRRRGDGVPHHGEFGA